MFGTPVSIIIAGMKICLTSTFILKIYGQSFRLNVLSKMKVGSIHNRETETSCCINFIYHS